MKSPVTTAFRLVLLVALAIGSLAAASDGTTTSAVLATDACGTGPSADELSLDAHDVCDVTVAVTTGDTVEPSISVAVRTAADQTRATNYVVSLDLGECALQFRHDRDAIGALLLITYTADAVLGCGDVEVDCSVGYSDTPALGDGGANCWRRYEHATGGEAEVAYDGAVTTFTVGGDALPELAQLLRPGASVAVDFVLVAPDPLVAFTRSSDPSYYDGCDAPGDCIDAGGDRVEGSGSMELPAGG